MDGVEFEAVTC